MRPSRLRNMICGLCEIIDGLISIGSLGCYHAGITFKFVAWAEVRYLERKIGAKK